MKIKDSNKILKKLLAEEFEEKIKHIELQTQLERKKVLDEVSKKTTQQEQNKNQEIITQTINKNKQQIQKEISETQLEINQIKQEIYDEVLTQLKKEIQDLKKTQKDQIIKKMLENVTKQINENEFELKTWKDSSIKKGEKTYQELKVTAESKTMYIEDSIDLRLEQLKPKIYKIIEKEVQ